MIPEWLYGKRLAIWDLETDFIPTSIIYMNGVSFIDIDSTGIPTITPSKIYTYKWTPYSNGSLIQSIAAIMTADYIVGHNLVGFDIPQVAQHLSIDLEIPVLDTLILSKIMMSKDELYSIDAQLGLLEDIDWSRPYALDAFGRRLGNHKIIFKEFDEMTEEMAVYCNQDVDLTSDLLLHLMSQDNFPSKRVVDLEHSAARIIADQTRLGFYFDVDKARALNTRLLAEKAAIARDLSEVFKPKFLRDGKVKTYRKLSKVRKYLPNNNYIPLLGTTENT